MEITINKISKARQDVGRGSDNQHYPGRYEIRKNGQRVGMLFGASTRQYQKGTWELFEDTETGLMPVRMFYANYSGIGSGPFEKAKAYAKEYFVS